MYVNFFCEPVKTFVVTERKSCLYLCIRSVDIHIGYEMPTQTYLDWYA